MDKLIRIPKTNKAKEVSLSRKIEKECKPLLDVEERRHNYDDRRSYTSYAEITKDFEDDLRCQDDDDEDDLYNAKPPSAPCSSGPHSDGSSSIVTTEDDNHQNQRKIRGSVEQQQLLIGNNNGNVGVGGRQRKRPILLPPPPPQHANDASVRGEECASMGRDTRSATVRTTVSPAMAVGARRIGETDAGGTDDGGSIRTDNHIRAKSSKTLQESIRESLTINNSATTFNGQGNAAAGSNASSFSKALLD